MQKNFIIIIAGLIFILAAVCLWQSNDLSTQKNQVAALQVELKKETERNGTQQQQLKRLRQEKSDFAAADPVAETSVGVKTGKKAAAASSDDAPDDQKENIGGMLAKMMKDPEMKKVIAAQQGAMIKTMYGALTKSMNLTPEEVEKFNALMGEHQMANVDARYALMGDDGDKAEATKKIEDQMKQFLGDDRYGQYTNYQQSIGDRMALNQFKGQLDDHPLTEDQNQQLLQLMIAERKKAGNKSLYGPESYSFLSDENAMARFMDQAALANQQVLQQAVAFLSPEQLQSLGEFQTNQLAMLKMGMAMGKQFMSKKSSSDTAVPGTPTSQ